MKPSDRVSCHEAIGQLLLLPTTLDPSPLPQIPETPAARREWWCLFLEAFVILSAAVVTCLPIERLAKGRYILAHFFSIASVIIMTALSANLNTYVWCAPTCMHASCIYA